MTVAVSSDGRDLANEAIDLQLAHLRIEHISGIQINRRERRHSADEHPHRMSVVTKTLQKLLGAFVQHRVVGDLVGPLL